MYTIRFWILLLSFLLWESAVDEESLDRQLTEAGCDDRRELDFQKAVLNAELPYSIGGGIGESRICMFFLRKAHIGEVHVSLWPDRNAKDCRGEWDSAVVNKICLKIVFCYRKTPGIHRKVVYFRGFCLIKQKIFLSSLLSAALF